MREASHGKSSVEGFFKSKTWALWFSRFVRSKNRFVRDSIKKSKVMSLHCLGVFEKFWRLIGHFVIGMWFDWLLFTLFSQSNNIFIPKWPIKCQNSSPKQDWRLFLRNRPLKNSSAETGKSHDVFYSILPKVFLNFFVGVVETSPTNGKIVFKTGF